MRTLQHLLPAPSHALMRPYPLALPGDGVVPSDLGKLPVLAVHFALPVALSPSLAQSLALSLSLSLALALALALVLALALALALTLALALALFPLSLSRPYS